MKTAVITGGTRGLGLELAKCLKKNDINVVICGTSQGSVSKALDVLSKAAGNGQIMGTVCDVTSESQVENLADYAISNFKTIDIWINNAGVNQSQKYAWEVPSSEIEFLLNVDLKGTINGSNVAMRRMISQGFGAIYNVEGLGSNDAFQPCFAIYGTTKRAVTYFTDALTKEVQGKNIPVIIGKLSPGIMITDFLTSSGSERNATELSEKTKNVYNILGDYPDVIADFLVKGILKNTRNGKRIAWLTNRKAAIRFMTAGMNKRDFFS